MKNQIAGIYFDLSGGVRCVFCGSSRPGGLEGQDAPNCLPRPVPACCKTREDFLKMESARPVFKVEASKYRSDIVDVIMLVNGKEVYSEYVERLLTGRFLGIPFCKLESWKSAIDRAKSSMLNKYYEKLSIEMENSDV